MRHEGRAAPRYGLLDLSVVLVRVGVRKSIGYVAGLGTTVGPGFREVELEMSCKVVGGMRYVVPWRERCGLRLGGRSGIDYSAQRGTGERGFCLLCCTCSVCTRKRTVGDFQALIRVRETNVAILVQQFLHLCLVRISMTKKRATGARPMANRDVVALPPMVILTKAFLAL